MSTHMQQRRGTAAQWAAANPVLLAGEMGWESDTGIVKVGNGVTAYNSLVPIKVNKTVRIPHTWIIPGILSQASGDVDFISPFYVPVPASQTVKLVQTVAKINSGTSIALQLTVNGTGSGGSQTITTTLGIVSYDVAITANTPIGFYLITPIGNPKNLVFTTYLDYTF